MPEYPVQTSKVQAPPLRDETLARDRLLDWLSAKIHRRAVLLVAEAGYGKTTLLADFTRRTRLRVLWFRLDRGDRDWVGFIAHLVAAFRIHVPEFGQATRGLIAETATTAPSLDTVLEAFLRELAALGAEPSVFVFDDFHLVDDSVDIRHVARELLARAPERMSFVFASRREPPIRLARLRAMGEVAELGTDDLRFDATETERLFRETYDMRLEPSLLAELGRRTEGWAASLQLVRAALHERNPGEVRAFISSLNGAEGHLYEYLAEEVIGELPDDLQQFLMRTSVLETVDLTFGPVAASVTVEEATRLIEEGERHGLFGKSGSRARHVVRAHPLVRSFLAARLASSIGHEAVHAIHVKVATAASGHDWRLAANHYLAAGRPDDAASRLAEAIELILGSGAYTAAEDIALQLDGRLAGPAGLILESRLAQQRGATREGLQLAEQAFQADPSSTAALLNLVAARSLGGNMTGAIEAGRMLEASTRHTLARMGRAYRAILESSVAGSLQTAAAETENLIQELRESGNPHFFGVAHLNLAYVHLAMGRPDDALEFADQAISLLESSSRGVDLVAAMLARAFGLAFDGRIGEARAEIRRCQERATSGQQLEVAVEAAQMEALLGESVYGWEALESFRASDDPEQDGGEQAILARGLLYLRDGLSTQAEQELSRLRHGAPRTQMAFEAQRHLAVGLLLALNGSAVAAERIETGLRVADEQSAHLWSRYGRLLLALCDRTKDASPAVLHASREMPVVVSMLADAVLLRLHDLNVEASQAVASEAARRPWRWRSPARRAVQQRLPARSAAAALLAAVGEVGDVRLLREAERVTPGSRLARHGYSLARRLADRVWVEDLGRVRIRVGPRLVEGAEIRRRVLALLCLLLTRPRFASTREEVIDSLWPDHDPASALNSLNQTAYFLRRVFEPDYEEETSPGYLGQDAEMIWLDPELVDCRSRRCLDLVRSMPSEPSPDGSLELAALYEGRFALDFAYDDWSAAYRDSLHASYLRVIEQAIGMDLASGQVARGTFLAERASDVDPDAEEVQVSLVRLYRMSGAHAAAAERYGYYERAMRDLGVDPVPYDEL